MAMSEDAMESGGVTDGDASSGPSISSCLRLARMSSRNSSGGAGKSQFGSIASPGESIVLLLLPLLLLLLLMPLCGEAVFEVPQVFVLVM